VPLIIAEKPPGNQDEEEVEEPVSTVFSVSRWVVRLDLHGLYMMTNFPLQSPFSIRTFTNLNIVISTKEKK